ncbi:MAG: RsmD family RNA methyltransferase [Janibacter sp.]|nr:RsmD family RNA methyltransferase [Janibacter sp.]
MAKVDFTFAGHDLVTDDRLLEPRAWTQKQSAWAADLLSQVPEGPVLELCAGAGHIGLAALRQSERRLVAVDREPVAADTIRANAERLGMASRVEVRCGDLSQVVAPDECFALVIADPPWVPTSGVGRFPEDPRGAIDGGADGLTVARQCVAVIAEHLLPWGAALLQLGTREQVGSLDLPAGLVVVEVREYPRGVLARLVPAGADQVSCAAGSSR